MSQGQDEAETRTPERPDDIEGVRAAKDFFSGLVLFAVAVYVLIESYRMPHFAGSGWLGSPGLTPGLLGFALLVLSSVLMARGRQFRLSVVIPAWQVETLRTAGCFALMLAYVAATPRIGYVPATFLLLFTFQTVFAPRLTARHVLVWSLGLSAVLTAVLWYVFGQIFFVPLP